MLFRAPIAREEFSQKYHVTIDNVEIDGVPNEAIIVSCDKALFTDPNNIPAPFQQTPGFAQTFKLFIKRDLPSDEAYTKASDAIKALKTGIREDVLTKVQAFISISPSSKPGGKTY